MAIPLSFLRTHSAHPEGSSLGDFLAERIAHSSVDTLLGCLCSTPALAIHSTDISKLPLRHDQLHSFVTNFVLPNSKSLRPLGRNDRVMIALPTGPVNAVALLSIACYHTCAPVNASCTPQELKEDAHRLGAKAILTTRDAEDRLELQSLRQELGCEIIFIEERASGPAGLFDMAVLGKPNNSPRLPSSLHNLDDKSLVLHTSGTSGKKKVVPYTLRSLIVGTWAVVQSWNLQADDVNSECADLALTKVPTKFITFSFNDAPFPRRRNRKKPPCPYLVRR